MIFHATLLAGAYVIEPEPYADSRGMFARLFCQQEFARHGLIADLAQINVSTNTQRGTLRGLHWIAPPNAEAKVVRCTQGAIFDVIVDMRPESPTHCQWFSVELRGDTGQMLYVPERFAHGFVSLSDFSEVLYFTTKA